MVNGMWKSRSIKRKKIRTPGGVLKTHKRKVSLKKSFKKDNLHSVKALRRNLIRKVRDEND